MLSNMNFEQSRGAKVLANRKEGYEHYCWKINLSFTAFDEPFAYFYVKPKYKLPYYLNQPLVCSSKETARKLITGLNLPQYIIA